MINSKFKMQKLILRLRSGLMVSPSTSLRMVRRRMVSPSTSLEDTVSLSNCLSNHKVEPSKLHIKIQNVLKIFASWSVILILAFCILDFMGCGTINEAVKGFAGISTKVLEKGRQEAITRTFNYDYNTCYNNVQEALKRIGAYIYTKDKKKKMLAIYISEQDTTPVGIFFTEIETDKTQIEISSPSIYAKEFIAQRVFKALEPLEKEQK